MVRTILIAGTALLLLGSVAAAQQRALAKACAADIKTVCQGVQPGEGRIGSCIKSHFADLSEPCQAGLIKAAAVGKACKGDVKQLCAGTKPGGGRIEACMKSHLSEVSDPCKDALSQATAGKS
jgi:hypothetical protein